MKRNGVGALEPRSLPVKPRPLPVRTQVQVHPPETPPEPPLPPPTPPKAGSLPRLRRFANGFAEGIKGAFTAESIAAEIPELILLIADKAVTRATVRKIQIKFIKEGFAKGFAAGVMGWTKEEVESTLMNRVTAFRVQDLEDPAGTLNREANSARMGASVSNSRRPARRRIRGSSRSGYLAGRSLGSRQRSRSRRA